MTDKQILIDGVDVSGCEYFLKGYCYCINHIVERMSENEFCKDNPNCYYKQLLRKEQECEELKDLNTRLDNQREIYWKGYQKLQQTLSDIKPILEVYADTKIGIEQPNGTYSMEIKDYKVIGGTYFITYNPNLAKTALDKINEVI